VKNITTEFFPNSSAAQKSAIINNPVQASAIQNIPVENGAQALSKIPMEQEVAPVEFFSPRQIDDMFNEAQLGSSGDNALNLVEKEMANPEEGPVEDMPKGSYVDYTV